jgi:hypothetical protein
MPTNRTRRRRPPLTPPLVQQLLDGQPIERTDESRQQLIDLVYFGWTDYPKQPELPKLAQKELDRWERQAARLRKGA